MVCLNCNTETMSTSQQSHLTQLVYLLVYLVIDLAKIMAVLNSKQKKIIIEYNMPVELIMLLLNNDFKLPVWHSNLVSCLITEIRMGVPLSVVPLKVS